MIWFSYSDKYRNGFFLFSSMNQLRKLLSFYWSGVDQSFHRQLSLKKIRIILSSKSLLRRQKSIPKKVHLIQIRANDWYHRQSIILSESRSRSSSKSSFKWSRSVKHLYFRENKVTLWNWTAGMYLWALQIRRVSGEKTSAFIKTLPCYIDLSRWQNYISSL